jgi:hypothetical protein
MASSPDIARPNPLDNHAIMLYSYHRDGLQEPGDDEGGNEMANFEQRLMGKDGKWIHVGDRVTSDEYWTYEVLDIRDGEIALAVGMPQSPSFYRRVAASEVDSKGRIVSEANEAGRQNAARWMEEQNRKAEVN